MKIIACLLLIPTLLFSSETESKNTQTSRTIQLEKTTRTVVLIRHAKSSRENPEWIDLERPLGTAWLP